MYISILKFFTATVFSYEKNKLQQTFLKYFFFVERKTFLWARIVADCMPRIHFVSQLVDKSRSAVLIYFRLLRTRHSFFPGSSLRLRRRRISNARNGGYLEQVFLTVRKVRSLLCTHTQPSALRAAVGGQLLEFFAQSLQSQKQIEQYARKGDYRYYLELL